MSFKKELQKFNRLVTKFEKEAMRISKKLESMSITLDENQEKYLGWFYILCSTSAKSLIKIPYLKRQKPSL